MVGSELHSYLISGSARGLPKPPSALHGVEQCGDAFDEQHDKPDEDQEAYGECYKHSRVTFLVGDVVAFFVDVALMVGTSSCRDPAALNRVAPVADLRLTGAADADCLPAGIPWLLGCGCLDCLVELSLLRW
jgi:hypothetical protein